MEQIEWKLPPHAAEVMAIFGFPHGADTSSDGLWWRTEDDGRIRFFAQCNDTFHWATADAEEILEEDMPLLRKCLEDLEPFDEEYWIDTLFAARKRGMRPMRLVMGIHPSQLSGERKALKPKCLELLLEAGPERDPKSEG